MPLSESNPPFEGSVLIMVREETDFLSNVKESKKEEVRGEETDERCNVPYILFLCALCWR